MRQLVMPGMYSTDPDMRRSSVTLVPEKIRWPELAAEVAEVDRVAELVSSADERMEKAVQQARQAELDARAAQAEQIAAGGKVSTLDRKPVERARREGEEAESEREAAKIALSVVWDRLRGVVEGHRQSWLVDSDREIERRRREYAVAIENLAAARDAHLAAIGEKQFLERFPDAVVKPPAAATLNRGDTLFNEVLTEFRREAGTERQLPRTWAAHAESAGITPAKTVGGPTDEGARVKAAQDLLAADLETEAAA